MEEMRFGFSGIYRITCLSSGKIYIGHAIDLGNRKSTHLHDLRIKQHPNRHLQRAYDKYGENNFVFDAICYCKPQKDELIALEQFYIDTMKPEYNICLKAGSSLGFRHSDATKEKLRQMRIGKKSPHSEEARKNISKSKKGKKKPPFSDEHKRKLSLVWAGRRHSEETKLKMSQSAKGRKMSENTKRLISESKKGERHPLFGKTIPEETKIKMSEARKLWWKRKISNSE